MSGLEAGAGMLGENVPADIRPTEERATLLYPSVLERDPGLHARLLIVEPIIRENLMNVSLVPPGKAKEILREAFQEEDGYIEVVFNSLTRLKAIPFGSVGGRMRFSEKSLLGFTILTHFYSEAKALDQDGQLSWKKLRGYARWVVDKEAVLRRSINPNNLPVVDPADPNDRMSFFFHDKKRGYRKAMVLDEGKKLPHQILVQLHQNAKNKFIRVAKSVDTVGQTSPLEVYIEGAQERRGLDVAPISRKQESKLLRGHLRSMQNDKGKSFVQPDSFPEGIYQTLVGMLAVAYFDVQHPDERVQFIPPKKLPREWAIPLLKAAVTYLDEVDPRIGKKPSIAELVSLVEARISQQEGRIVLSDGNERIDQIKKEIGLDSHESAENVIFCSTVDAIHDDPLEQMGAKKLLELLRYLRTEDRRINVSRNLLSNGIFELLSLLDEVEQHNLSPERVYEQSHRESFSVNKGIDLLNGALRWVNVVDPNYYGPSGSPSLAALFRTLQSKRAEQLRGEG